MPRHYRSFTHREQHRSQHGNWLRAAVLGANDGIISTASVLIGIAAAGSNARSLLIAGVAALVAGAMAMAAGEYVSVSTQQDSINADLRREAGELAERPEHEHDELAAIYVSRGLAPELAESVAAALMKHDALQAHARDELGISEQLGVNAFQAALASAASFSVGAALPLILSLLVPMAFVVRALYLATLIFLAALGLAAAQLGGAPIGPSVLRVVLWGIAAMAFSHAVGSIFR